MPIGTVNYIPDKLVFGKEYSTPSLLSTTSPLSTDAVFAASAEAAAETSSGSRSESGKAMSNSTLTQGEKADKAANIISSAGSLLTGASNLIGSITGKGTPSEVNNYYEDDSSKTWIIVGILLVVVLVVVLVVANRK